MVFNFVDKHIPGCYYNPKRIQHTFIVHVYLWRDGVEYYWW